MSTATPETPGLGRRLKEEKEYWAGRLSRELPRLSLPADRPRPAGFPELSERLAVAVPDDLFRSLGKLTGNGPFLCYTTLCAALQVCLSRYGGSPSAVVGSPARKVEDLGPLGNALAILAEIEESAPFSQLLKDTRQTLLDAYARQHYPLDRLLLDLGHGAEARPCPLFGVVLALREIHEEPPAAGQDLDLVFSLAADHLAGEARFDPAVFDRATVERFVHHYLNALRGALADPKAAVREISLLDETEQARLARWSAGAELTAPRQTVHRLVEAQADRDPAAPAVLCGDDRLSHGELDARANRLARHLRRLGVGAESRVAIVMESSVETMVAILATLKAGAAYVPLDPRHPKDRLAALLSGVRPAALITAESLAPELAEGAAPAVRLDRDRDAIARESAARLEDGAGDAGLVYMIYTSGSTGTPNGVMVPHRALVDRAHAMRQMFDLRPATRQLQLTSLTFDMSCEEILPTWIFGGAVVLLQPHHRQSGLRILAECERLGATKVNMAASLWHNLVDEADAAGRGVPSSIEVFVVGAESPAVEKLHAWHRQVRKPLRFFNIYGPTEGTIMATFFEMALGAGDLGGVSRLPIGRPLPGARVHLLDAHLRPVPAGVPGELYIGGEALARGYLDRPALTAGKFVPDPWSPSPGARLYKTGDLGRHVAEGLIEFLGRVDFQVKIRGFRIELGEIEEALRQHPAVRQTVLIAREDLPGSRQLIAYVVPAAGCPFDEEELRRHLADRLPDYMVPAAFAEIAEIPLTTNGKIDRKALPVPGRAGRGGAAFVPPRTPLEHRLAGIWTDLLKVEQVGAEDNFFQLGGHSLLVMQLVSRVHETFHVDLPIERVFERPTVGELAAQIEAAEGGPAEAVPLVPVAREHRLPVSFAQQRLWFIDQLDPGNPLYNVPSVLRLRGSLDPALLRHSLNRIVERHETLRTTFAAEHGQPVQEIHPERVLGLPLLDLGALPPALGESAARQAAAQAGRRPFDLARGPLLEALLVRLAADDHLLLVTAHHIVCDLWSIGVFTRELTALYRAAVTGREPCLPELPVQYADFAAWQRRWLTGEVLRRQVEYWRGQLGGAAFELDLPFDRPRPAAPGFTGAVQPLEIPAPTAAAVERLSRSQGATPFTPLLAAFFALLHRYSGQNDLVVGSPIVRRGHTQTEPLIGCFLNTLILRARLAGDPPFLALLDQVREATLGAFAHQDLPFEKVVEEIDASRSLSRQPLFQVMFVFQTAAIEALDLPGLAVTPLEIESGTAKFDLTLSLTQGGGRLGGAVEYSSELFDAATIRRLVDHLGTLLGGIAADPGCRISDLPLLSPAERQQMVRDWNDTRVALPARSSIHALFAGQVERTPDAPALVAFDETLTYAELDARANRLAHALRRLGVGLEDRVGICLERSAALVVAALAALKADGVYVPLDPGYPAERLDFLIRDAGIAALVVSPGSALAPGPVPRLTVDAGGQVEEPSSLPVTDPPSEAGPGNLAYVLFTSGSTGLPKGVEVPHAGVLRLLWQSDYVTLDGRQTLLQVAPMAFDASTLEVWGPLLFGGRCVLTPHGIPTAETLRREIEQHGVDTLFLTTSLFNAVVDDDPGALGALRQLGVGGEAVSVPHMHKFRQRLPHTRLVHCYGPTESTTFTACLQVPPAVSPTAPLPIGGPIVNTRVYVLHHGFQPVGAGVLGELFIGGLGLARGYQRRPSLTAERFVPDPFGEEAGGRLYRTGDLVRWRFPGVLEFAGRRDHQVKIRGHRIELGEIETHLKNHAKVADAAVLAREDRPGSKVLVAWVTGEGGAPPAVKELLEFLQARLPDYMVPKVIVPLPAMPLTSSGKIDRRALQSAPLHLDREDSYLPPVTPAEEMVAGIWAALLGVERVGRDAEFFSLGGHSLLATQVVSRVRQAFSIDLPVRALFENPQLAGFAQEIERVRARDGARPAAELQRAPRGGDLPLSYAQQRLWFLHQLEPDSPFYNMPVAVRLQGRLDAEALIRSVAEIQRRHEVLRTSFPAAGGTPVQRIAEPGGVAFAREDLSGLPAQRRGAEAMRRAEAAARQPFDLAAGPVIRGLLLRLQPEEHVLVLTLSHIVSDGWSIGVLTREIGVLYDAFSQGLPSPLAELPVQYADFAVWQRAWLQGEVLESQLDYWRERLRGAPELLALPADRPRPAVQSFAGSTVPFALPRELSAALHRLSHEQDATLFMTVLAAFQALLYRQSHQADFCVGTPIANRTLADTEPLIGFFVNTLVMRARLAPRTTFRELLRQVREDALGAYAHQDVPFEMVVEALRPQRSAGHSPLFQVMLSFEKSQIGELRLPGLDLSLIDAELGTSKRDLSLTVSDSGEWLQGGFTYSSDLFDSTTVRRWAGQLELLLASAAASPDAAVGELEILSGAARHQLLVDWNDSDLPVPDGAGGVHTLFERQVDRAPESAAVAGEEGRLTYRELDARANRLAHHLRRRGVGPEVLVALFLERSEPMIVALLAVAKAGGAYLPLDPAEPVQHLAFVLEDARPRLVLTQDRLLPLLPEDAPETVSLDGDAPLLARESAGRPAGQTRPDHLLYVIYTSGSTGRPKGVQIAHRSMLNYVASLTPRMGLPPGAGYAMVSTLAADLGCTMLYPALLNGGCLHVLAEHRVADPAALAEYFERHAIDALKIVPSHLAALLTFSRPQAVLPRRCLVLGGEASRREWIEQVQALAPGCAVINHYGPTETTVGVLTRRLERGPGRRGPVPLGAPIANTRAYVLDRELTPVPLGAAGQLHVGGAALARGYLRRPALTAERFIPDPFSPTPGGRLYATGDLFRHRPDGTVEFLGRADQQIKLRGFRIELGEIEAALRELPPVRDAAVVLREDAAGDRRLVAYVVADAGQPALAAGELRAALRRRLPEPMVPAAFVQLAELPLTPNGKLDRRALPLPDKGREEERNAAPPQDGLERELVKIWQDLLGVEPVGTGDDFFALGGHSLMAVTLMARIEAATGRRLPLTALLQQPTVAHLASLLRQGEDRPQPLRVLLQARGDRRPFFCVHPAGGAVLPYVELARQLAPDQPFHAFQDDGRQEGGRRVEDLAARYLAELLEAQPEGPYALGGHSFGGVVAYEMARQLQARGHAVALLALLDSAPASPGEERPPLLATFALQLGLPVDGGPLASSRFARLSPGEQLAALLRHARRAGGPAAHLDPAEARRQFDLLAAHVDARLRYTPQRYAGRVTLFRAQEQLLNAEAALRRRKLPRAVQQIVRKVADPSMGWGELAAGGVEVHEIPGDHFSMLRPPHVATLARELRACLEQAESDQDPGAESMRLHTSPSSGTGA